jgi:prepilin-type N-terminal cleavage/methylation domain-containing protein
MTLRTKRGFTLIEVLLVGLIIAFVAAIATPSFVNSMKGQRLRQARRSVMACGKYARTMAISRQQPMNLILTVGGNRIAVEAGPVPKPASERVYTRDQVTAMSNGPSLDLPDIPPAEEAPAPSQDNRRNLSRVLDGVRVKSLNIRDGLKSEEDGAISIPYRSNGTCPPYEVVLSDEDGTESTITVDFLGDASHEED